MFAPADAKFATPGVLSWSVERGAELELVDLSDPWPTDFEDAFTVHGQPHEGEAVTLLEARVRRKTAGDRTLQIDSWTLVLGGYVDVDDRWPRAYYCPASLHEWLPETGLSIDHSTDDGSRLVVEWNAPERRTVELSGGEVSMSPGANWSWAYRRHPVRISLYPLCDDGWHLDYRVGPRWFTGERELTVEYTVECRGCSMSFPAIDPKRHLCRNCGSAAGRLRRRRGSASATGRQRFRFVHADGAESFSVSFAYGVDGQDVKFETANGTIHTNNAEHARVLSGNPLLRPLD